MGRGEKSWQARPALTPSLSPRKRENHLPRSAVSERSPDLVSPRGNNGKLGGRGNDASFPELSQRDSLSPGERAGVRAGVRLTPCLSTELPIENIEEFGIPNRNEAPAKLRPQLR